MDPRGTLGVEAKAASPSAVQERFMVLSEVISAAQERLDPKAWNFLEGGVGDEFTLQENRRAFDRWTFRPRLLAGIGRPSTTTHFMGISLAMPLLTAPFARDWLFDPEGQLSVARANEKFGTASIVPRGSTVSLEKIAEKAPKAARLYQLLSAGSPTLFQELVARAEAAGYTALCITADTPTRGWRERMRHDRYEPGQAPVDQLGPSLNEMTDSVWSWSQLEQALSRTQLPFMIKGVLTADDARKAADIGARAVLVSNHGGRQLDAAPASLDKLPEVAAEVGAELEIALDGGIRRGTDILKAIALGANAVVIGRLAAMGLAAAGEEGVYRVLELLHAEMIQNMTLLGRETIADIDRSAVEPHRVYP